MSRNNLLIVDSFTAGASSNVCKMGGANFPFDSRPYARALTQTEGGYPLMPIWIEGGWDPATKEEYSRFLKDCIVRGSFPMLAVAAIAADGHPEIYGEARDAVDRNLQERLDSLIKIGRINDEFGKYIEVLVNGGRKDEIHEGASGEVEGNGGAQAGNRNAA